ncbi:MAG: ATP synthase F0 subunit C [Candidatus Peribacteria bacterium]|nr:MAG: ATP synthase F0 subunit C [Candidatus Peribacteria bacterium]
MGIEIYLGAGLAIGLAGFGVSIGEAKLGSKSLEVVGKNPDLASYMRSLTILGMALVESAAIYGLIVAILILVTGDGITGMQALGAGLAIGLAGFGVGWGEGELVASSMDAILRNPANKEAIRTNMILYLALVESAAIYGLIIAILTIFVF